VTTSRSAPLHDPFDGFLSLRQQVFPHDSKQPLHHCRLPCSSQSFTVASPTSLQTWSSDLQQNLSSLVQALLKHLPADVHENLNLLLTEYSAASYTTVAAVVLSLLFLLARYLMSSYGGYVAYGGSRNGGSPYTSNIVDPYTRNLSNHFEYIDADQGMLQDSHRHSVYRPHDNQPAEDPDAPDVILVRYMASMLQIEFPPYSISEERAYVGQLRDKVARHLQTDPRRVRLIYKKRDLKHDSWPLRKYNMKQNSEVAAVKTEGYLEYSDRESHSSSGEDVPETTHRRTRPRAPSSVRHRSDENLPRPMQTPSSSSGFLHPNGHVPSMAAPERQSRNSLRPEPEDRPIRREPSRTRGTSPHPAPAQNTGTSTPIPTSVPKADPSTPLGKLQALSDTFSDKWLPLCQKFIKNPPSAAQDREKEHRKLSESVMTHIILKADDIEVDSADARGFRKGLINQVNEVMKKIDAIAKA
jgi:hypothetical protein